MKKSTQMKKYIIPTLLLTLSLIYSCDYNEHYFDNFEDETKVRNIVQYEYNFENSDINTIVAALNTKKNHADSLIAKQLNTDKAFSENVSAEKLLLYLFPAKYKAVDVGSTVTVTYPYNTGRDSILTALSTTSYVLNNTDYRSVWGDNYVESFSPSKTPEASIPNILNANFGTPKKGTYKNVEYYYSSTDPITTNVESKFLSQDFEEHNAGTGVLVDISGWINKNLTPTGTIGWQCRTYSGNKYAQISANATGVINDTWLVTKQIDLTNSVSTPELTFDICVGYYTASCLSVLVSQNFDGNTANLATATWTDITDKFAIPTTPSSGYGTLAPAGSANLSAYKGKKIYVAFRYDGDDTSTPKKTTTYQIDKIKVSEMKTGIDVPNKTLQYASYLYNGSKWTISASDVLVLQPSDYKDMGLTYLTTAQAPNYLPAYLKENYKYAQKNAQKVISYKTSSGNNYADRYTYNGSAWTLDGIIEKRTGQFIFSNSGWLFDPTITVTFQTADYQVLVDYVLNHEVISLDNPSLVHANKNAEYYYGFSSYYRNISYRETDRTKDVEYMDFVKKTPAPSNDEKMAFLDKRTIEGLRLYLVAKYPDIPSQVSGIDQYVLLNVIHYYDGPLSVSYQHKFKKVDTSEKWEWIERTAL